MKQKALILNSPETTPDSGPDDSNLEANLGIEIRGIGIPPRPSILDKIDREMGSDAPNFRALGDVISSDVGIAASLLKIANSPFYGFNRKVRSVQEALIVLGINIIAHTVAGLSLKKQFEHIPNMERFWDASACTARVSGWLAQQLTSAYRVRPEEAYTFGLCRDVGMPILMVPFSNYPEILKQANQEEIRPFTEVVDVLIGMDHAMVGAAMAKEWLFPQELILAIKSHHDVNALTDVSAIPQISRRFIAVAQIAEYLIQRRTGMNSTHEWRKLGAACLETLGITEEGLEELYENCHAAVTGD